ncbi:MAG: DUF3987 domain-containing protein [Chitinophagaceae bacterium]
MAGPLDVENINRRIAYYHHSDGCDKTGWDLTQMLRVPNSYNFKHMPAQAVRLKEFYNGRVYTLSDFDVYPELEQISQETILIPIPTQLPDETAHDILAALANSVHPRVNRLFSEVPTVDWSTNLWDLEQCLFEVGATPQQVFIVVREAACNKFSRDGRPDNVLWQEVQRAQAYHQRKGFGASVAQTRYVNSDRNLLSNEEVSVADDYGCFIDDYKEWGTEASDAPPQYHIGGALVILSSLMAANLKLDTSFGSIIPNVWLMIVADTTLTRKSTTMDMAMDVIVEVTPDALMATDGSVEGIMQAMSLRAGIPSIMLRDEFSGLLELMNKRDYYAGMMEMLTKLYDNKPYRRQLKKETVAIEDPVFIMYTGGVKEKLYSLIQPNHITSGFFPRFIFVVADADFNRIRPLGPPTERGVESRRIILDRVRDIHYAYSQVDRSNFTQSYRKLKLTDTAWRRFNAADEILQTIGMQSGTSDLLTPMLTRLGISGIKVASLLAGSEQLDGGPVTVDEIHIVKALSYLENFKEHAIQVVNNTGVSTTEKQLQRIFSFVEGADANGIARSIIMQKFGLMARDADVILTTLSQRGMVKLGRTGGTQMVAKV